MPNKYYKYRLEADILLYNSIFTNQLGLLEGKMGMVIFFYIYSSYTSNNLYYDFAGELLDEIIANLSYNDHVRFADGLSGIGWGLLFLESRGYISGDMNDILEELDKVILSYDISNGSDLSFYTGLEGIIAYIYCRRLNTIRNDSKYIYDKFIDRSIKVKGKYIISSSKENYTMDYIWAMVLEYYSKCSVDQVSSWKKILIKIENENK